MILDDGLNHRRSYPFHLTTKIIMNKYLLIILTPILSLISSNYTLAQETLYLEETPPPQNLLLNSTSTQVTYETEEVITQSFYQTIEPDQALIYTRGNCENVNLIPQLENIDLPYICRSIDQPEQYRELVVLLYDIGVGGSIPLPVIYYHQKVLFDPTLEHLNILIKN